MNQDFPPHRVRIIKASHLLQSKVGSGEIEDAKIQKMQRIIDTTTTDFVPMGLRLLEELAVVLKNAEQKTADEDSLIRAMAAPVMQIKANASMFHYELIGTLASIVLDFLEHIDGLDDAALEIVNAHHQTLSLILNTKMSGMGGEQGAALERELRDACKRYFSKMSRGGSTPDTPPVL